MMVSDLIKALDLEVCTSGQDTEVTGCYVGDLLSWVMGRAQAGEAWVTIMTNLNVAAVAKLTEVACVILTEGVNPEPPLKEKAEGQGIWLLKSRESSFKAAAGLAKLLEI